MNKAVQVTAKYREMNVHVAMTKNIVNTEYCLEQKDKDHTSKRMITMTSVDEDCDLLKWAGINFGDIDSYKL